ncbi:MAG: alanine racemase [Bacteroidales bacterium]|nr:alanine racemase [Bacteroidales bacterium]
MKESEFPSKRYLTSDSRSIVDPAETTFAAIRTSVGDGHRFIAPLYESGVREFLVEYIPEGIEAPDAKFIVVENVPETLGRIARARLQNYSGGIIVTGSRGKTTMKELLYCALGSIRKVRRSPGSWNSSIGIPLAVWDMTSDGDSSSLLITEAGIDGPGQADAIREMLDTSHDTAVVTPLDSEHDEAFDSHEEKLLEKISIISNCSTVIYADTDPAFAKLLKERMPEARLIPVVQGSFPSIFHALAHAVALNVQAPQSVLDTISEIPLLNKLRSIAEGSFNNTVYRDFFTPDIRSLRNALDFMRRHTTPAREKVLLLGELLEGTFDDARDLALKMGIDRVERVSDALLAGIHQGSAVNHSQVMLFGMDTPLLSSTADALESAGHDTTLQVDLDAVEHNFNHYRKLVPPGTGIIAMVKASAYGMGAVEIGKTMQTAGAASLAVAVIEEGIALREAGITMPVMVLNPVTNRYPALFAHRLEPAVFSPDELRRLIAEAEAFGTENYPVHIKLDTGMHRVGLIPTQIAEVVEMLKSTKAVKAASIFSHLATADCLDKDDYTRGQLDNFNAMATALREGLGERVPRHILNTAGMMRFPGGTDYEMARLGIGLYGLPPYPGHDGDALKPVGAFRSHIISLKHWPEGTPIGYGCKGHTVGKDSIIATVPVGYADGIDRRLGNGAAKFVVRGVECPTIGVICMDLCMVDVTAVPEVSVGDTVEIFGPSMPVSVLADTLGTITYEILTSVAPRVKRVYIKH